MATKIFLFFTSIVFSQFLLAQVPTTIILNAGSDGTTVTTCLGGLFDSGGAGAIADYSNDEDYTITFCPDAPDVGISILWTSFDLDCTDEDLDPDVTDADHMIIYDGDDVGDPIIGVYYCFEIDPFDVFAASIDNPTGCLTIQFVSNGTGTGNFTADITCDRPCDPSTAAAIIVDADNVEGDSIAICVGEEVTFADDGSTAGESGLYVLEKWVWNWADGSDADTLLAPDDITHTFDEPGWYVVTLTTIDDNECTNNNSMTLNVFVSTFPTFDPFPGPANVCAGTEYILDANAVTYGVTWDGFPISVDVEDNCMEDRATVSTPLVISGYDDDISLDAGVPDILNICVDIEHSFMGDFVLTVQCPTGQTMRLHNQLGGGTYLGEPIDMSIDCDDPSTYGVPYHYCFTPEFGLDTWAEAAAFVATLPEGDYAPVDDFSDLDGCPINGTWNLIFSDLWGIDDGSLPGWEINFADYLSPESTSFTPTIGAESDSSYWGAGDPTIIDFSADANTITILHEDAGVYEYTYYVVNSFGCEYDSTVTITVGEPALPFAGFDDGICWDEDFADGYVFAGTLENPDARIDWEMDEFFGGPPAPLVLFAPDDDELDAMAIASEPGTYRFVLYANERTGICPEESDTVLITFSVEEHTTDIIPPSCSLDDGEIIVNSTGFLGAEEYSIDGGLTWQPSNVFDGLAPGTYTVISRDPASCEFESEAVLPSPGDVGISVSSDTTICINGTASPVAVGTGGLSYTYFWYYDDTEISEPTGSIDIPSADGPTTVYVYVQSGEGCVSDTLEIELTVFDPLNAVITTSPKVCPGDEAATAVTGVTGGDGTYFYSWTTNGSGLLGVTTSEVLTNPLVETEYCATVTDGCETDPILICATTEMGEVLSPSFTSDIVWGCEPTTVNFENTTPSIGPIDEALWSIDGKNYTNINEISHEFFLEGLYDVNLRLTSADGCVSAFTANNYVTIYSAPKPAFFANPNPTNIFNTDVGFVNQTSGDDNTYEWLMPSALPEVSSEFEPQVKYPEGIAANYEVKLYATNEHGCVDSTTRIVQIFSDVLIFAPNVFTPDGDQYNETWRIYIEGIDIYDYHLTVFNRWGEKMWESFDAEAAWDGSYGSSGLVNDGMYVWMIEAKDRSTDKRYRFDGIVQVMK
ncbi:T9SS C-terminal target domain-containing protein [Crocinitomix catalasitica]|uniref:T9SS C-terminal target domain-containing protein n=1 Tax=Crocinitomix catalasitica TaxID=184607 RepID=UPI000489F3A5|nr:T9SS C-terminal target domain-containing protein [Crocinitomix catalasitica]